MKARRGSVVCLMAALLLCVAAVSAEASTIVSFQDGFNDYDGTADTLIKTQYSARYKNYGAYGWTAAATPDAHFEAGFIRFDDIFGAGASQVPAGQTIVSATLQCTHRDRR